MPEIARFFGIAIAMYEEDRELPHFHARYGDPRACIEIGDAEILAGSLPPQALGLVVERAAGQKQPLDAIEPLRWIP
jgi:hypothetical protein